MSYGQNSWLFLSFQNSYGTFNTSSAHFLEFISESITLKKEQLVKQGMRSVIDQNDSVEGKNTLDGDINVEVNPYNLPVLFNAMMDPAVSSSGGLTTYVFNPIQKDFDSNGVGKPITAFLFPGFDTSSVGDRFSDLMATNLEISYTGGDFIKAKLSLLGKAQFSTTFLTTPAYPEAENVAWHTSSITMNNSWQCSIEELTVTIDQPAEGKYPLCRSFLASERRNPKRIKRAGPRTVNISGTLTYEDRLHLDLFLNQTNFPMTVACMLDGSGVGFALDLPKVKFTEFPTVVEGPDELMVSFSAVAQYHSGSGTAITATVVSSLTGV